MRQVSQQQADDLLWFHSIDLGGGVVTKGAKTLEIIRAEADVIFKHGVAGKTVLDIGAWNGAFSFEAERRGAKEITALDHYVWTRPEYSGKKGFDLARSALGSRVKDVICNVYNIADNIGQFDVVLFCGVLYHLEDPLLAMRKVAPLAKDTLILETHTELNGMDTPVMRFYPNDELAGDASNWWGPNVACLKAMLTLVGFPLHEVTPNPLHPMRVIIHAWRR